MFVKFYFLPSPFDCDMISANIDKPWKWKYDCCCCQFYYIAISLWMCIFLFLGHLTFLARRSEIFMWTFDVWNMVQYIRIKVKFIHNSMHGTTQTTLVISKSSHFYRILYSESLIYCYLSVMKQLFFLWWNTDVIWFAICISDRVSTLLILILTSQSEP